MVGEAQVFDAEFEHVYDTVFDQSIFEDWFTASGESAADGEFEFRSDTEIRETLQAAGITHVFVNWAEILRYRAPGSYGYTDFASPETFRELVAMRLLQPLALPDSMLYVPDDKRQTLEQWAPELLRTVFDNEGFVAYELFEVLQEE